LFTYPIRHLANFLPILSVLIILIISIPAFDQLVFSQQDGETTMMMSHSDSEQAITSYSDALVKAPLLVAQCTIVGIVFNHIMLSRVFQKRILIDSDNYSDKMQSDFGISRRLFLILILSVTALIASATGFLILQVYNLSSELGLGFSDTFPIVIDTSVGTVWLLRVVTSILIFVLAIVYYVLSRRYIFAKKIGRNSTSKISNIILFAILISGSINIISNSMVSHNAAAEFLPWLAISIDWFHVMAVSIWLGGLFYMSLILLYAIRISSNSLDYGTESSTKEELVVVRNSFSLAIMLPYFSMIAIICLGMIGISGLYMAWLQLQSVGSLFDSVYGNILILKLCVIAPMIALGAYHQIKLHFVMVQIAQRGCKSQEQFEILSNTSRRRDSRDSYIGRGDHYDPFRRFSKTIKIESLIGIVVLVISAFLTITSPPTMVQSDSQMQMQMQGSESVNNNNLDSSSGSGDENEITPKITDGFTIAALILAVIVLILSLYYYRKSKQELKVTVDLLKKKGR
jgi:copper transport protein